MSDVEEKFFSVTREDDCIWLRDNRENPPIEIHLVPKQAYMLGFELQQAAKIEMV